MSSLKIANLNVRSLLSGFSDFDHLICSNDFSVVGVTETWLNDSISDNTVSLMDYRLYRCDRNSRGGGVALYMKSCLKHSLMFAHSNSNLEQLWVKCKVGDKSLAIGVVYRQPRSCFSNSVQQIEYALSQIFPEVDGIVCMGDFNVNFSERISIPVEQLVGVMKSFGLGHHIDEPTRITSQSSTLIDQIFISGSFEVNATGTMDSESISDHRLTFCGIHLSRLKKAEKFVTFRDFRCFSENDFKREINLVDWNPLYSSKSVDDKITFLTTRISSLFNRYAPVRTVRVTKKRAPWLTDVIRIMMDERRRAFDGYKISKTQDDFEAYKNLRNYTLNAIRREKKAYIDFISRSNGNSRVLWKQLKNLNTVPNSMNTLPLEFNNNVEEINNHFLSIADNLNEDCSEMITHYKNMACNFDRRFEFTLPSPQDISQIIYKLKSNAVGDDGISGNMIRLCMPEVLLPITHLVNSCLELGCYPSSWKTAVICPLPKVTQPKSVSDLRPISILPFLSKILEKWVYKELYDYLTSFNILPTHQSGFRSGHSVPTALAHILDDVLKDWDGGLVTAQVLLDFTKAFDTINHSLLCAKLEYYGLSKISLQFFESFLNGRKQYVKVGGKASTLAQVHKGVPQGSILGPLLFLIYTADFENSLEHCRLHLFADDSQIYFGFHPNEAQAACSLIDNDRLSIIQFAKSHNQHINPRM